MSLFGSILGAGVSLLGSGLSNRSSRRGSQAALAAMQPQIISATELENSLSPRFQTNLGLLQSIVDPGETMFIPPNLHQESILRLRDTIREDPRNLEASFLSRLRQRAGPGEAQARAQARARVFNQGRLGLLTGGGVTGRFNPELASLEEGLARADLQRQDLAFDMARRDQATRVGMDQMLLGLLSGLRQERLSGRLAASAEQRAIHGVPRVFMPSPAAGQFAAAPHLQQARSTEGFFSGLGQGIADSGLFNFGGGGAGQPLMITGPGLL